MLKNIIRMHTNTMCDPESNHTPFQKWDVGRLGSGDEKYMKSTAKMRKMPFLYRLFFAKEPYN